MNCKEPGCGRPMGEPRHAKINWKSEGGDGHPFLRTGEATTVKATRKAKKKPRTAKPEKKLEKVLALVKVKGDLEEELAEVDEQLRELLA